MKKLLILTTIFIVLFSACRKDDDDFVPNVPPTNDTTIVKPPVDNWDNTALHQYKFLFGSPSNLKSANDSLIDTTQVMYVKFVSYDSEDKPIQDTIVTAPGQRNIHEIEVFSDSINIAKNTMYTDTNDVVHYWNTEGTLAYTNSFETLPAAIYGMEYMWRINDDNINSRWSSNRDDGQDTVFAVINLRSIHTVDSIRLTLGEYKQTFDLFVSSDSINWVLVGSEEHPEIPIYVH